MLSDLLLFIQIIAVTIYIFILGFMITAVYNKYVKKIDLLKKYE